MTDRRRTRQRKAVSAPLRRVVNEQSATVMERNRIDAAVRVRQAVACIGPQLRPPSLDQHAAITRWRVRQRTACARRVGQDTRLDGVDPRQVLSRSGFSQLSPRSVVRSR